MKRTLLSLLLLPPFFAQAQGEMSRPKLSDLQVSFNQLIKKNPQQNEDRLCGILRQISDDPIARKPHVIEWLDSAYARLDAALGRASLCSRLPVAALPAPEPAALPMEEPSPVPIPSAPSVPKPILIPEPSAPEIGKTPMPTMPSAPSSFPEPQIKEPRGAAREQEIPPQVAPAIPTLFDQINTIIAKNKFQARQTWSTQDQKDLDRLVAQATYDKNFSDLLQAYLQEYSIVQKPAQFALQTAQAVNFLYARPLNNTQVQKAITLLEKKGGTNTAKVLKEWPGVILPVAEQQREKRVQEMKDILDVSKVLANEPYEVWIDKIKKEQSPEKKKELEELDKMRQNFILEVGHEKEPDSYRAMLKGIEDLHIVYAQPEAEQLKQEIKKQLYDAEHISDQEAINRLFDYIEDLSKEDITVRTDAYALVRILENAKNNKDEAEQLKNLIDITKHQGSTKAFIELKKFVKPDDELSARLRWRVKLAIDDELKKIRG